MPWTRWARAAARNETSAAARNDTIAAAHVEQPALEKTRRTKYGCSYRFPHARPRYASAPARRNATENERKHQPLYPRIDPHELAEIRDDFDRIDRELKRIKRDIAWNAVIDDAIRVCRLLAKVEEAEALKYRPDQPRVPAGNPDGGQWVDDGGGSGASAAAADAETLDLDALAGIGEAAQSAAKLRQLLQLSGQIVTAAGAGTSALAVGILMASANATGGALQEQVETLADGTVVTVSSSGDTPDKTIRAESPDGTVTYATVAIDKTGGVTVLSGEVHSPDGGRQPIDPNAFAAAAGALINAASSGSGGDKTKPSLPDTSGTAATPPEDEDPEESQTRENAEPSARSPREMNHEIGNDQRKLLTEFFDSVEKLGKSTSKEIIPLGLTRGTLLKYREVAIRALNPLGSKRVTPRTIEVQSRRLKIIEKALEILK